MLSDSERFAFSAWRIHAFASTGNAYDAVQVRVDFDNGMSINFHNNWITPADFEGPVNQGHEIVGADGGRLQQQPRRLGHYWNCR